jgi:hypothetical protein
MPTTATKKYVLTCTTVKDGAFLGTIYSTTLTDARQSSISAELTSAHFMGNILTFEPFGHDMSQH